MLELANDEIYVGDMAYLLKMILQIITDNDILQAAVLALMLIPVSLYTSHNSETYLPL